MCHYIKYAHCSIWNYPLKLNVLLYSGSTSNTSNKQILVCPQQLYDLVSRTSLVLDTSLCDLALIMLLSARRSRVRSHWMPPISRSYICVGVKRFARPLSASLYGRWPQCVRLTISSRHNSDKCSSQTWRGYTKVEQKNSPWKNWLDCRQYPSSFFEHGYYR